MTLKKIAAAGLLTASALVLAACGQQKNSQSQTKQVLNWTESAQISTQDPSLTTDSTSFQALLNTQEGLYRLDKKQKPQLALAKSAKVTDGGKTYTFVLRDAKWSNGRAITANDFVYSYRRSLNPKTKSSMAFYLYQIVNAEAINAGKKPVSSLGVKALSKNKLQIKLVRPVSYFKLLLAFPLFFPENQQFIEKVGSKYGTAAKYTISSGPFKLTKWTGSNKQFTLVKNQNYWDKKNVKLDKVNETISETSSTAYNLYQAGKLDETYLTGEQVKANKGKSTFYDQPASAIQRLELNRKKVKAFNNFNIRRALSLAIDRESLAKVLSDGSVAAKGFVPSGMGNNPTTGEAFYKEAYVKEAVSYNLKEAKKYLAKGYKELGIKSLNLNLTVSDTDSAKQVGEFLQSKLGELPGVKITVTTLPYTTLISLQSAGNYQLTIKNWQAILGDPINFLDVFEKDSSYNTSGFASSKYDQLLNEAENVYGNKPVQRWKRLVAAEKLLMNEQGTIPLIQTAKPQLVQSYVKNVSYNPLGIPYDFKLVYIKK
ncbi:peptide ABC transporter substrate-binding protein [Lactobacillus delbrueckii subsp. delbrueckii DSM 20074 = JCM 1012]|uniref:peptide ABC transporter substrate-binding protein n=1 Tax=Lactobacillus delbrueckii TaxID=1584 RepID=UPI000699E205|nr:peptide ABC transporter substrate-binding protein [Lactobacillus delbrueckii]APP10693.1 peptide ABC transporter substrate-binding protein [Lactobacillus delbrueckii subsp. delbrueckii DSM 20074 = JCM 1012]KNZ38586.1 peptide ABC transporter substrate-binding protein [Lactobacillus delbrueckii subsp. delbrueckii]KRK27173.1 peptide ABC transporter substrate-binding protein [Lactobacillus delbrueckii subsp. delbrueckii DSM 20074 = JCM 1012]MCT3494127.1 peptide ABC transporter substrate-binding p